MKQPDLTTPIINNENVLLALADRREAAFQTERMMQFFRFEHLAGDLR